MAAKPVDLLVVGAGITGAGIARDAAMRGIRTALVDKGDYGSGTSGKSSRLIHGGLRYLELGDLRLVFEASRERRTQLGIAPHLVWPRTFIFPVYRGSRVAYWKLAAGLLLYDLLAMFRNVGRHKMLSKRQVMRAEPGLRDHDLKGGARYYDAQCDDARLTLANVRSAHRHGALTANYAEAMSFDSAGGRIRGARIRDRVSGEEFMVRASVVVNACGPWSDGVRGVSSEQVLLRLTKGAHAAVPRHRLGNSEAITITSPIDGRVMFILPWGNVSYIGTTDTDCEEDPDDLRANAEDVIYLLRSANAFFPNARLQPEDVISTWAGLRPLLKPDHSMDPDSVSREHKIVEDASGLISIVGGKLTTYRRMAAEVVDKVARRLHELDGRGKPRRADTAKEPLPGGETKDLGVLATELVREGLAPDVAEHLVRAYGSEAAAVVRMASSDPLLQEPIVHGHPAMRAELLYAMRREMSITLCDLLIRRTHIFYEAAEQAAKEAEWVADFAAQEMGWDENRKKAEFASYLEEVTQASAFRDELARLSSSDAS